MEKSWKNLLQEWCIKCKIPGPIYDVKRIDTGIDHSPIWEATCECYEKVFSSSGSSKKEAELSAANIAYEYLRNNKVNDVIKKNKIDRVQKMYDIRNLDLNCYNKIVLVDGENIDLDISKITNEMLILIFIAKNSSKNIFFDLQQKYDNYYVFISESVGRDAADHLLTFYAGKLSMIDATKDYYVLTKDHYGEFLEKFMNNCKYICSLNEIK